VEIQFGARTDVGRVRDNNEDSFKVVPELNLYVLSDGMGGEACGEVASKLAVEAVAAHCQEALQNPSLPTFGESRPDVGPNTNRLASGVRLANRMIHDSARKHPSQRGMGATVVAAWLDGQRMSLAHVGDSRIYLLRSGDLAQLTQDHSLVAEQVRRGIITQQQAEQSDMQSVLIRALGIEEDVEVDSDEQLMMDGDIVLLCSDGLTRMVSEPEIASTLLTYPDAQAAADRLVELANEYGGEDNVTVIVFRAVPPKDGFFVRLWRWLNRPLGSGDSGGGN
jgi:serine/threonine protein phosphatase PrpC